MVKFPRLTGSQPDYEKKESAGCGKRNANGDDDGFLADANWI